MSLSTDIEQLRDSILNELTAVHDYYTNTKYAWRIVQQMIGRGTQITIRNLATETETEGNVLSSLAQFYVTEYLASATFQQFVSLFEDFVFGLMRNWYLAFPQSLEKRQVKADVIFMAADLNAAKETIVDSALNEVRYRSVRKWFDTLNDRVKLGCPTDEEIARIAEIKASRDVLVHNRGIANRIYEEKAGAYRRYNANQKLEVPEPYHTQSWELIRKLVQDIAAAAIAKASAQSAADSHR